MVQLRKINQAITEELDRVKEEIARPDCMEWECPHCKESSTIQAKSTQKSANIIALQEILVKLSAEIRRQMDTGLRIAETWDIHKRYAQFQTDVCIELAKWEPKNREGAIAALKNKQTLRGSVQIK
jgi:predicted DNA-binding protein (UPF0278 family)